MKTNELRIGNYVNIEGDVVKVKEIYEKSIYYANGEYESYATEDFIHPIDLTEEVLVKIGFVKDGGIYYYEKDIHQLRIEVYERYICLCYCELVHIPMDVTEIERSCVLDFNKRNFRCLHQLQNAYYLLTNEELEVGYEKN